MNADIDSCSLPEKYLFISYTVFSKLVHSNGSWCLVAWHFSEYMIYELVKSQGYYKT